MKALLHRINSALATGGDSALLALRLILVYSFWGPGLLKLQHLSDTASWFESIGIPFGTLNALLAGSTELLGAVLLLLGLGTQLIALPLIFVLLVAIFTVHAPNGFAVAKELAQTHYVFLNGELQYETHYHYTNGYEIPLYFVLMLLVLATKGAGAYSIDRWMAKN